MSKLNKNLSFNDPKTVDFFMELIEELIDKKLRNAGYDRRIKATVNSYNSGNSTATITLQGGNTQITGVLNISGQSLSANNIVFVLYPNNGNKYYITEKIS